MINALSAYPTLRLTGQEQRIYTRLKAKDGLCAISYIDHQAVLCDIIDIGEGGFSFLYIGTKDFNEKIHSIKIITIDGNYVLNNIPVKITSNVPCSQSLSYSNVQVRRIGAAFENVKSDLVNSIINLLQEYTETSQIN